MASKLFHLLIANDNRADSRRLEAVLHDLYRITECTDGRKVPDLAAGSDPPDLILLDSVMSHLSGFDISRQLKANPATRHIPVIFTTANDRPESETHSFDYGGVDFIPRPFSRSVVRTRVATQLALKAQRDRLENLIRSQEISIDKAKAVLAMVNGHSPAITPLGRGCALFFEALTTACYAEGGDHYFMRRLAPDDRRPGGATVFSLKDQSGHQIGCILRSIVADLIHQSLLTNTPDASVNATVKAMNREICHNPVFGPEDFLTGIFARIDHHSLMMDYVSFGHPAFILIRGQEIRLLPDGPKAAFNLPMGFLEEADFHPFREKLAIGDRLILFTDGLIEMPVKKGKAVISAEALKGFVGEILAETPELPVSEIGRELIRRIADHSGETVVSLGYNSSDDDVTLLCLEIERAKAMEAITWQPKDDGAVSNDIRAFYDQLARQWHRNGFQAPESRLRVVLEEVLLNAWRHGNQRDPAKTVTIEWRLDNRFHLSVTDGGEGFDPHGLPDPTDADNRQGLAGRGILLVRHLADAVEWRQGGRCITVSFNRQWVVATSRGARPKKTPLDLWAFHGR